MGSLVKIAEVLNNYDVKIYAACTHGVLSGKVVQSIENSLLEKLLSQTQSPFRGSGQLPQDCAAFHCGNVGHRHQESI